VEGSLAVVGGTVDNTDDPTFEGGSFYLGVSDSGLPKGEGDEFLLRLDPGFPNASCGLYPPGTGGGRPILKGDILVIDATPPA